jgi:hypothetical protein
MYINNTTILVKIIGTENIPILSLLDKLPGSDMKIYLYKNFENKESSFMILSYYELN